MGNPFTTGPFNCCTCPEPPDYDAEVDDPLATYINLCGCPTVSVVCVSESKTATLCGFNEGIGYESSPPLRYRKLVWEKSGSWDRSEFLCDGVPYFWTTFSYFGSRTCEYGIEDCVLVETGQINERRINRTCSDGEVEITSSVTTVDSDYCPTALKTGANWIVTSATYAENTSYSGTISERRNLSIPDTEDDALARATATDGTSCSSIYELRTTSFSFTQRTSKYTATASNLVIGVQYEGCVRIRRREAYSGTVPSGADTAWYDVEPDTIAAFTATATEEEVATDVALPNVQGYEYEVVGAYVWPTSAGCDCPTSYVTP